MAATTKKREWMIGNEEGTDDTDFSEADGDGGVDDDKEAFFHE